MKERGTASGFATRKTAVPSTRVGGDASSDARHDFKSIAVDFILSSTRYRPRRHVSMTASTTAARLSGNHPPSCTLRRLDEKNAASTAMKKTVAAIETPRP